MDEETLKSIPDAPLFKLYRQNKTISCARTPKYDLADWKIDAIDITDVKTSAE